MIDVRRGRMLLLAVVSALVLAACGGGDSEGAADAGTEAGDSAGSATDGGDAASANGEFDVFALLPQGNDQPYGTTYLPPFRSTAGDLGMNLTITNSQYDADTQLSNCAAAVAAQPDLIILWPAVADAVASCLNDAERAGIPVTVTNSDVLEEDEPLTEAFSGPNTFEQGAASAELFCEFADGEEMGIIMVNGLTGNTTAIGRENGFEETINENCPNVSILSRQPGNWNKDEAQVVASEMITEVGPSNIGGAWAADDTMIAGVIDAMKARGIDPEPLVITSIGNTELGNPLVKSGELDGTIFQSSSWDGENAAEVAHQVLTDNPEERIEEFMPNVKVTEENADDPEVAPEW